MTPPYESVLQTTICLVEPICDKPKTARRIFPAGFAMG